MSRGLGGRRQAGLLPAVCVAALVLAPPAAENVTVVQYKGFQYRTRDGASPTVSASSTGDVEACEGNWAALPSEFSIAPSNDSDDLAGLKSDDAYAVTKAYDWHTCCLVYDDGVAWKTLGSSAGSWWTVGSFCGGAEDPKFCVGYEWIALQGTEVYLIWCEAHLGQAPLRGRQLRRPEPHHIHAGSLGNVHSLPCRQAPPPQPACPLARPLPSPDIGLR
jgi:hypothetical protein